MKKVANQYVCMYVCVRKGIYRAKACFREKLPYMPGQKKESISVLDPMETISLGMYVCMQ